MFFADGHPFAVRRAAGRGDAGSGRRRSRIECTGRFASELGYHVTLVSDATAAFTREAMHAAHVLNGPTFAHAILTTRELVEALPRG